MLSKCRLSFGNSTGFSISRFTVRGLWGVSVPALTRGRAVDAGAAWNTARTSPAFSEPYAIHWAAQKAQ